jgi:hypothetical protein
MNGRRIAKSGHQGQLPAELPSMVSAQVTSVPRRDFFAAKIDQVEDRLDEYDRRTVGSTTVAGSISPH